MVVSSLVLQSLRAKAVSPQEPTKDRGSLLRKDFEKYDLLPLPSWASWQCVVCNGPEKINWTLHLRDKDWDFIPNNLVTPINLCPQTF